MPNSRRLCWYEHEVMQWVESQRPALPSQVRRPRGRPTKQDQLTRARFAIVSHDVVYEDFAGAGV